MSNHSLNTADATDAEHTTGTAHESAAPMTGFDAEFVDLPNYIIKITERIWEGRQIDLIHRFYTDPCVVETPSSLSRDIDSVINGTRATLAAFPDRRLLAEDIIWSGDARCGYMSSHRIISPMTHQGDGVFGPPTGRAISVRTIADCWCINNRIAHEWLVRDQGAIAVAIGQTPRTMAERWLAARGGVFAPIASPVAPAPYAHHIETSDTAAQMIAAMGGLWTGDFEATIARDYDAAITAMTPNETLRYGQARLGAFWQQYRHAFSAIEFRIEHAIVRQDAGAPVRVALRWRISAQHTGAGYFGEASGRRVEMLGISHHELRDRRIYREWLLLDEIAIWMQLLSR